MAYRYDSDLEFIKQMTSEDLNDLVYCLTHGKDNEPRYTEELTTSDLYKNYYPDHHQYWKEIVAEIQCFGANTFATMFRRGQGVLYKEMLIDVCNKMKVNYNKDSSTDKIEKNLLMKILADSLESMNPKELKELAKSIEVKKISKITTAKNMMIAFQSIFRAGGINSYLLTVTIANGIMKALIGRGISFAGNAAFTRTMAILTGPIGWGITGLWTAIDIASPAYRVTIPAVFHVAALRQKYLIAKIADSTSLH